MFKRTFLLGKILGYPWKLSPYFQDAQAIKTLKEIKKIKSH
jgi:hypothetical protein